MCATDPAATLNQPQQDLRAFLAESLGNEFQRGLENTSLSPEQISSLLSLVKSQACLVNDRLTLCLLEGSAEGLQLLPQGIDSLDILGMYVWVWHRKAKNQTVLRPTRRNTPFPSIWSWVCCDWWESPIAGWGELRPAD